MAGRGSGVSQAVGGCVTSLRRVALPGLLRRHHFRDLQCQGMCVQVPLPSLLLLQVFVSPSVHSYLIKTSVFPLPPFPPGICFCLPSPLFLSLGHAPLPRQGCSPPALSLLVFAVSAPNSVFALQRWLSVSPGWFLSLPKRCPVRAPLARGAGDLVLVWVCRHGLSGQGWHDGAAGAQHSSRHPTPSAGSAQLPTVPVWAFICRL